MCAQFVISSPFAVVLTPETLGPSRCRLDLSMTLEDTVVSPYLLYVFCFLSLFIYFVFGGRSIVLYITR